MVVDEHGPDCGLIPFDEEDDNQGDESGGAEDPRCASPIIGNEHPVEQGQEGPGREHVACSIDGGDGVVVDGKVVEEAGNDEEDLGSGDSEGGQFQNAKLNDVEDRVGSEQDHGADQGDEHEGAHAEPQDVALEEVGDDAEEHDAGEESEGCQKSFAQQCDGFVAEPLLGADDELDGIEMGG